MTATVIVAVVAIPVRNEEARIEKCLRALADQVGIDFGTYGVLLFLNNCTDGTIAIVESLKCDLPYVVRSVICNDIDASAGWARRNAMDLASDWLSSRSDNDQAVILTTDADSRVDRDWLLKNLSYIASGGDAVAGRFVLEPKEAALLPEALHARGALESAYETLLIELSAHLDPDPFDPWPCHWTGSGATLAVRRDVYEKVGGIPVLALGEDQAFVDLLRAHDYRVRHPLDVGVITSGRLHGRAPGGAADTMKLRCHVPENPCDDRLERIDRAVFRYLWRGCLRRAFASGRLRHAWFWACVLNIPRESLEMLPRIDTLGQARIVAERAYVAQPLKPAQLPLQIKLATVVLRALRRKASRARSLHCPQSSDKLVNSVVE